VSGHTDWASAPADAPHAYQQYMVPAMFAPLADRVCELVEAGPGDRALDVACGTGALTRALTRRADRGGRVVGIDRAPAMLAVAREEPAVDGAAIEFVEGSAGQLPFGDDEFSIVTCQQGFQFFADRSATLAEFRRVVAPGGRVAVACWCDIESSFGFDQISRALDRHLGTEMGDMIRFPFVVISDPAELRGLFESSGFDDVVIEIERVAAGFAEPERFAERIIAAGPVSTAFAAATEQQRRAVIGEVTAAIEPARDGDWVTFEMPALVAVARV
jgi:SAM-dependent methyltransferase